MNAQRDKRKEKGIFPFCFSDGELQHAEIWARSDKSVTNLETELRILSALTAIFS